MLHSVDGGNHWDLIRVSRLPAAEILEFVTARAGWAGVFGATYRTFDGGSTWHYVYPR